MKKKGTRKGKEEENIRDNLEIIFSATRQGRQKKAQRHLVNKQ